jgi:hypothetical protein
MTQVFGGGSKSSAPAATGTDPVAQVLEPRKQIQRTIASIFGTSDQPVGSASGNARRRRQRDSILSEPTGTGEEPNVYRPQLTGA